MYQTINSESLVARTARELAELSLSLCEGDFIGAEDDLLSRLGVSRPTLRQAAKIAENDRLISVRRGIKGGFYASRPDAQDAIRTLARFLRLKGGTLGDIMAVSRLVAEEAGGLACGCTDEDMRAELAKFVERIGAADSPSELISLEAEFSRIVSEMSGNPVIELVMAIGFSFGMSEQRVGLYQSAEQRSVARDLQNRICRAILDRDVEITRVLMRRRSAAIQQWIDDTSGGTS
ncbi:GntR family transcriptional regulator [Novosphingobium kunmingense]|uniref:GntR family transcriptional regulator n=1 Tax=Novosphingobium kunmingense TaxID=1211806 RepID=A0A2N0H604_9SPHN|nr:FCD domain-containing protein [Novosphingobium kunmingense]PKB14342.1 GntR family transcriptional regulator [Novosphingobium kunmingense]